MRVWLIILISFFLRVIQTSALSASAIYPPIITDSISTDCTKPITWRVGSIDPRFKIDEETLKNLMKDVQQVWSDAIDSSLIEYSDSGEVAIHVIYSEDQGITDEQMKLTEKLRKMRMKYYSIKMDYQRKSEKVQKKLLPAVVDYEEQMNEIITQYNHRFSQMRTLRNAIYFETGSQKKVNIYHFEDIDNLRVVLAHEFGHALGLSHTKNPMSIMYPRIKLQNDRTLKLTDEDIQAIRNRCSL